MQNEKILDYSMRSRQLSVCCYIETRNLIVLLVKGSMTVALDKRGFKEGTKEAFMSLLADKMK